MARTKKSQSKHDALVREIARELKKKGFDIAADVRGFPTPDTIGGSRPDVVARKGKARKIVEVETPDSVGSTRDAEQQRAFRAAAKRAKNTTFMRRVTKE